MEQICTPPPSLAFLWIFPWVGGWRVGSHYTVWHIPPGATCFGLPCISPGAAADDHVDRLAWCWQPAISRTCHTSFCVLSQTYLIPPETAWPCSNGKSTAQTCWWVNASRGHPQPTGARGPWINAPVPQWTILYATPSGIKLPLTTAVIFINSPHGGFPSFPDL